MPSNYIPRSIPVSENRMEKLFAKASRDIVYAVRAVKKRKTEALLHVFPFDVFGDAVAQKAVAFLSNYDRYFWVTDKCDSCGLCEKICPDSNIIMMNGIPTWHGHCEHCLGCLQWCPKEAIQFRKVTLKYKRYHHPAIKADDMILKICR